MWTLARAPDKELPAPKRRNCEVFIYVQKLHKYLQPNNVTVSYYITQASYFTTTAEKQIFLTFQIPGRGGLTTGTISVQGRTGGEVGGRSKIVEHKEGTLHAAAACCLIIFVILEFMYVILSMMTWSKRETNSQRIHPLTDIFQRVKKVRCSFFQICLHDTI